MPACGSLATCRLALRLSAYRRRPEVELHTARMARLTPLGSAQSTDLKSRRPPKSPQRKSLGNEPGPTHDGSGPQERRLAPSIFKFIRAQKESVQLASYDERLVAAAGHLGIEAWDRTSGPGAA